MFKLQKILETEFYSPNLQSVDGFTKMQADPFAFLTAYSPFGKRISFPVFDEITS